MLDEVREYGLYTCDPDAALFEGGMYRLRWHTFVQNHFSGLSRAMEVVARKHLFDVPDAPWPDVVRMEDVERILSLWCAWDEAAAAGAVRPVGGTPAPAGAADGGTGGAAADAAAEAQLRAPVPDASGLACWVTRYLGAFCDFKGLTPRQRERKLGEWERRTEAGFAGGLFDSDGQWANDRNRVTFQRTIANALLQGPLKRRYLAGSASALEDVSKRGAKRGNRKQHPYVLGFTAMILLQGGGPGDGFVEASPERLLDWLGVDRKYRMSLLVDYLYKGDQLFEPLPLAGIGSLWRMNGRWLDEGRWRLVDADDPRAIGAALEQVPGCTFFGDVGPCGFEAVSGDGATVEVRSIRDPRL